MIGNQTKSKRRFLRIVMTGLERHEWVSAMSKVNLKGHRGGGDGQV